MDDKPIVDIKVLDYFDGYITDSDGREIPKTVSFDIVFRRQDEDTWTKLSVTETRPISNKFKNGEKL